MALEEQMSQQRKIVLENHMRRNGKKQDLTDWKRLKMMELVINNRLEKSKGLLQQCD